MIRLFLLCLCLFTPLFAGSVNNRQIIDHLTAGHFAELEDIYAAVTTEPSEIYNEWPSLGLFFTAFEPRRSDADAVWAQRLETIAAWRASLPESKAARLALAAVYNGYGYKARGTGWAREVTEEGWKLFRERRATALSVLTEASDQLESELYYHYLMALIAAPDDATFAAARHHLDLLTKREPRYAPAYSVMGNYLLPRWHGKPGDLTAYAGKAADQLGGNEGDFIYASLLGYAARMDAKQFMTLHDPDMKRVGRGFAAAIAATQGDRARQAYYQGVYANTLAQAGDWRQVRLALIAIGPAWNFSPWDGRENYEAHLQKSGLRSDLSTLRVQESKGDLVKAEAGYLALQPDRARNHWMSGFYLRHGRTEAFVACPFSPQLTRSIDAVSMDDLADLCRIYPALGNLDQARAAAQRFDKARGHNLTGKITLYEIALRQHDPVAAEKARFAITGLKTDRKSYKLAQDILRESPSASIGHEAFDWEDGYAFQGAIAVALYYHERGEASAAKALLETAVNACTGDHYERERMNALIFHPPASLKPVPTAR